jgi:hypothetical protein
MLDANDVVSLMVSCCSVSSLEATSRLFTNLDVVGGYVVVRSQRGNGRHRVGDSRASCRGSRSKEGRETDCPKFPCLLRGQSPSLNPDHWPGLSAAGKLTQCCDKQAPLAAPWLAWAGVGMQQTLPVTSVFGDHLHRDVGIGISDPVQKKIGKHALPVSLRSHPGRSGVPEDSDFRSGVTLELTFGMWVRHNTGAK